VLQLKLEPIPKHHTSSLSARLPNLALQTLNPTLKPLQERSSQYGGSLRALNGYPISPGPALVDAVDHALRRVCHHLINGELR